MKFIIFICLLAISTTTFCLEKYSAPAREPLAQHSKYDCKVQEISGVSEYESEQFDMFNGPIDGDIYSIVINKNTLYFTNTSNKATIEMSYNPAISAFEDSWFIFGINKDDLTFMFRVNKPNYSVDYAGTCTQ